MIITKDKGKNTFTITDVTLGKLLAIQTVFRKYCHGMIGGMSPVQEDILVEVNRAINDHTKNNKDKN